MAVTVVAPREARGRVSSVSVRVETEGFMLRMKVIIVPYLFSFLLVTP